MIKHYDIGLVGWWYNLNYGGTLTYYALNKALEKLGYSICMIERSNVCADGDEIPRVFAKKHYNISPKYSLNDMYKLNELCECFIVGSDQLWNPYLMTWSGPEFFLSFVNDSTKKMSYATSFGNIEKCDVDFVGEYKKLLDRFDAISVREDYAVDICKNDFGLDAKQVCDPVFLIDKSEYEKIAKDSTVKYEEKYALKFFLDPNEEKLKASKYILDKMNIDRYENFTDLQFIDENVAAFGEEKVNINAPIEQLVEAYRKASFIITDSFHGTCFAIIFNKPFISFANFKRGQKRFISLFKWLGISNRLIMDVNEIYDNYEIYLPYDYKEINKTILESREKSLEWLKHNISKPKINKEVNKKIPVNALMENPDFKKIQILVTLLRDYRIKHVVLSPGGRDVPIVRMFEYNADTFIIHNVTDERSAAYYGLGIAAQLQEPVVCVCTSGTAVSNYLPAVTEAYYTGVPLIMVTADRRQVYFNQGEDQTIPQQKIFDGVIKKSVTLPEGSGFQAEYQTRRDISDCILETTHNGLGPVHINISIDNISIGANMGREYWKLLPFINPHIRRISACDDKKTLMKWVDCLKVSNRILIVYGQNCKPNTEQLNNINRFASKYNCVIVTDFISNLNSEYCVKPYNMLNAITQDTFNKELSPDIIISVGGKSLMNDPITFKIRGGVAGIRHWSVTPNGNVKDFFFRLTSVLEMSQDFFFEWFADNAGNIQNNREYYDVWRSMTEKFHAPKIEKWNAHYVQSKFIPAIPADSILHLGVGQSFYDCRRYKLDPSISVFCNMGTNGIDGCASTFMGQCSVEKNKLCFLLIGDLAFFYDMNSIWNKELQNNIRILLVNNNGTDLLRSHNLKAISSVHNTSAKGWVGSVGFEYLEAHTKEEFHEKLNYFLSRDAERALFFEIFCE